MGSHKLCVHCGYDQYGLAQVGRCPECGAIRPANENRLRRSRPSALGTLLLGCAGWIVFGTTCVCETRTAGVLAVWCAIGLVHAGLLIRALCTFREIECRARKKLALGSLPSMLFLFVAGFAVVRYGYLQYCDTTVFAKDFDPALFQEVCAGMSRAEVDTLLGTPLREDQWLIRADGRLANVVRGANGAPTVIHSNGERRMSVLHYTKYHARGWFYDVTLDGDGIVVSTECGFDEF